MLSSKAIGIIKNSLMLAYDLTNGDDEILEVFHEFGDHIREIENINENK